MLSQIDTKDILFICGGAFVDLEKTISERSAGLTIVVVVYSTEIALRHLVSINYLSFPCGVRTLTLTSCTSRPRFIYRFWGTHSDKHEKF